MPQSRLKNWHEDHCKAAKNQKTMQKINKVKKLYMRARIWVPKPVYQSPKRLGCVAALAWGSSVLIFLGYHYCSGQVIQQGFPSKKRLINLTKAISL